MIPIIVFACHQDVLSTIIRSCSSRFFFLGLPGFTLLVGDFITSSAYILNTFSSEVHIKIQHVLSYIKEDGYKAEECSKMLQILDNCLFCQNKKKNDKSNLLTMFLDVAYPIIQHYTTYHLKCYKGLTLTVFFLNEI